MPKSIPVLCGSMMAEPYSLSMRVHNAAYRALGIDYTFVCFGIEDPAAAIQAIKTLGIRGMNVSMPYKSAVIPLLDRLDEAAAKIGAVNTIDNRDGVLTGYNTDFIGATRALEEISALSGKRIAVLGAGGAARAIAYGTKNAGADVTVFNRSAERGERLASELGLGFGGELERFSPSDFDILINATSVGYRAPEASPLKRALQPSMVVMDAVFMPLKTKFLREAEEFGCQTIPGTRMLVHQACGQVELYTGHRAPLPVMEEVMLSEIRKMGV